MARRYPTENLLAYNRCMPKFILSLLLLLASTMASLSASAADFSSSSPLSLGIVYPVQFPNDRFLVKGLRLNVLAGKTRGVQGIDLAGVGNITDMEFSGIQAAGLFNWNRGTAVVTGLQAAIGANINVGASTIYGVQIAIANIGELQSIYGVQAGLYNRADHVHGIQIGLVNIANNLHGLQIGLANYNSAGPFILSPLINFGW